MASGSEQGDRTSNVLRMSSTSTLSAGDPLPANCELIEVHVSELKQLFNAIDPSPFRERDLDPKAEAFIVDWAKEASPSATLGLAVYLDRPAGLPNEPAELREAIHEFLRNRFKCYAATRCSIPCRVATGRAAAKDVGADRTSGAERLRASVQPEVSRPQWLHRSESLSGARIIMSWCPSSKHLIEQYISPLSFLTRFEPTNPVPPVTTLLMLSLSRALGAIESQVRVYS